MADWTRPIPRPISALAFSSIMADVLRLPEETLAMSFMYINRYQRFCKSVDQNADMNMPILDPHTLSLASLNLASKTTEAPRRLREFLLPAWRLLHAHETPIKPLTFPSPLYDSVRATVVQAELILLRALQFDLRLSLPLHFIPRYLDRTVGEVNVPSGSSPWQSCMDEPYEAMEQEYRDEYRVVDLMDTAIARACTARGVDACRSYHLSNFFPARTIAAACVYAVLEERGLQPAAPVASSLGAADSSRPLSATHSSPPVHKSLPETSSPASEGRKQSTNERHDTTDRSDSQARSQSQSQSATQSISQSDSLREPESRQKVPRPESVPQIQQTGATPPDLLSAWLDSVTGNKVHVDDFVECLAELRNLDGLNR